MTKKPDEQIEIFFRPYKRACTSLTDLLWHCRPWRPKPLESKVKKFSKSKSITILPWPQTQHTKQVQVTHQIKSLQWLQNVGCLKNLAINLWSFTSNTFFWRKAPRLLNCFKPNALSSLLSGGSELIDRFGDGDFWVCVLNGFISDMIACVCVCVLFKRGGFESLINFIYISSCRHNVGL